jgi:hypothetical protein
MFSVFDHVVKMYAGTKIVRQFSSTMNAPRAVWGALTYRYVQSPAAHIMTSQLQNKITTSQLTMTYPGTYENYIDSFCQLLSDYDNLVTFEKHFTEDMKIDLLLKPPGRHSGACPHKIPDQHQYTHLSCRTWFPICCFPLQDELCPLGQSP